MYSVIHPFGFSVSWCFGRPTRVQPGNDSSSDSLVTSNDRFLTNRVFVGLSST